ncbi:MAG TPA: DUF4139 domain-containing protein [Arenimonas sp.]|uniref:DUF4139 domain-containing protein n=1 Tax=Arenimonas sp. TaxID=1872635 RepID=UPI002D7ED427|nr:DUF4139 domain-containing protein [Arenimonas sp.]HEU0153324.1 DUF4139 domain-containing protein [Arenimonas sp.]
MKRTLLAAAVTLATATAAQAADTTLTLYSGDYDAVVQSEAMPGGPGYALVSRAIGFDLASGSNEVQLGGLPAALDASTVRLRPEGDARVQGQRFDFALAGQDDLLRRTLGQIVTVEQSVGDTRQSYTGVLLAAGSGLTLRLPDGRVKVLANYSNFELPRLPAGLVNEPTLSWTLAAGRAGRQSFDLAYATAGLAWRADYQVDLSGGARACRMDLEGAAMVANRAGADFNDVALVLVAGEPNRTQASGPRMAKAYRNEIMMDAMAAPAPQAEASGEYHAYRIPGSANLPQGSLQRIPLVAPARGIDCSRRYDTRAAIGDWRPPQPMIDANFNAVEGEQPVIAGLDFTNAKKAGLGLPLPAGRVRVFDGGNLLGEAMLGHTPANAEVELALGTVFDLTAERKREAFSVDRAGRQMEERISVLVRNAKDEAATVRIHEAMPRWSDWEIVSATVQPAERDAQSARFDLAVPAGGEARLTYTVRYRWAPDVRID